MFENITLTILILILQIIEVIYCHKKYDNKKFDIFHITYQIVVFTIFQILIWKVD